MAEWRDISVGTSDLKLERDSKTGQYHYTWTISARGIFRRARHIVLENARVLKAADAFQSGLVDLGKLMADSHRSLREDFEVSCPELDAMVEIAVIDATTVS